MSKKKITECQILTPSFVKKLLDIVDQGLTLGMGKPIPGQMCVEAAVNYAMGAEHDDQPSCVAKSLREFKIHMNDDLPFKNKEHRAESLRRVAVAQLGSKGNFNKRNFCRKINRAFAKISGITTTKQPYIFNEYNVLIDNPKASHFEDTDPYRILDEMISYIEGATPKTEKYKLIEKVCESVVQVLVEMDIPGTKFLYLTEK